MGTRLACVGSLGMAFGLFERQTMVAVGKIEIFRLVEAVAHLQGNWAWLVHKDLWPLKVGL